MFLVKVFVESFHEGCLHITNVTSPGFIISVIAVHVIHQPSESTALFPTQLWEGFKNDGNLKNVYCLAKVLVLLFIFLYSLTFKLFSFLKPSLTNAKLLDTV